MPSNPPINIRELGKAGVLKEDRFYQKLSEKNNYVSKDTVKDFYLGLVKVIVSDIRENGICRLPHIGDIALVARKSYNNVNGVLGKGEGDMYALQFYANYALRGYFREMSARSGEGGSLDPRSKVLGKKVIS